MRKETEVNVYRKVPVKIRAIKFDGTNAKEVKEFCNGENTWFRGKINCGQTNPHELEIYTLEGTMIASIGDYIIQGVSDEYYPCKPDIFKLTYERLNQFGEVIDFESESYGKSKCCYFN